MTVKEELEVLAVECEKRGLAAGFERTGYEEWEEMWALRYHETVS